MPIGKQTGLGSQSLNRDAERLRVIGASQPSTSIMIPQAQYLSLNTNATLTQERVFTPGADLVAVDSGAGNAYTLGRSGNKILLFDSGGSALAEYAATNAGMDLAIAAATSGDMIWLPVNVVLSGTRAVPAGVAVRGASMSKCIANCYFPSGTIVENINYNSGYNVVYGTATGTNSPYLTTPYLVHSSSGQWGINTPPSYTGLIVANRVGVVSTGAGSSYLEGPSVMLDRAAVGNFASLIYATAGGLLWNIGIRDASSTIFWRDGGNFNTLATLTTAGAFMAVSTVRSKPDTTTAGVQLDHNSATGDFVLSLSPANLLANRRVTFGDVDGTNALGAGTLTSSTTNDVTVAAHTHAITASTALVAPGAAQYQVLTTGANPYPAGWSSYYLDGTAGGKTILAVTNTKTLTLTAVDDYNLTIPATGTAALATGIAGGQTIYGGTAANNDLILGGTSHATKTTSYVILQPIGGNVGIGTTSPVAKLEIEMGADRSDTPGASPMLRLGAGFGTQLFGLRVSATGNQDITLDRMYGGSWAYVLTVNRSNGNVGIGMAGPTAKLHIVGSTDIQQLIVTGYTTQAVATPIAQFTRNDAAAGISAMLGLTALGSGANGDGGSILYNGKSSTTAAQAMGLDQWLWVDATHASRKARRVFNVYDTAVREAFRIEASGTAAAFGFLGHAVQALPTAYTQTYATASRIHANITAVDPGAYATGAFGYVSDAMAAAVHAEVIALRADIENIKQVLNQVIDDLQGYGLLA